VQANKSGAGRQNQLDVAAGLNIAVFLQIP